MNKEVITLLICYALYLVTFRIIIPFFKGQDGEQLLPNKISIFFWSFGQSWRVKKQIKDNLKMMEYEDIEEDK